jgi:hypothetical protein
MLSERSYKISPLEVIVESAIFNSKEFIFKEFFRISFRRS